MIAPGRFFDGRTAIAHPVEAVICGETLEIRSPDGVAMLAWPIRSLVRTVADAPGDQVTLRMSRAPERLILLNGLLLGELAARGAKLGAGRRAWSRRAWMGASAGLLATIAGIYLLVDALPAVAVIFVPPRIERAWSTRVETVIAAGTRRCEAPAGLAALTWLIDQLAAAAGLKASPHVVVLDSAVVNAFTLPDGRIVIMRGLITTAGDGDEFAGVMAHELGHALHHDPTREMIRRSELNLLASLVGGGGSIVSELTALFFDRHAEAAADASALETLRRAGLATDGLGRFMTRLQTKSGGTEALSFLSDHPTTASRIAALTVVSVGAPALSAGDWASIQTICSAAPPRATPVSR